MNKSKKHFSIYKITCTANGKVYIGQTRGSIKSRWYAHCRKDNPCRVLGNAINKYGRENFIIEEIDKAYTKEDLDNKEIYWISYYNSTDKSIGYNIAKGGSTTAETRRIICLNTNKIYNSIVECCKELNLKPNMVGSVCAGRKYSTKGLRFAYLDDNNKPNLALLKDKYSIKKVMCYETGIIYDNCLKASKELGLSRNAVSEVAYGRTPTAGGYHFFFLDKDNKPIINKDLLNKRKRLTKVRCIETGKIYNSPKEASEKTNTYKESIFQSIRKGCRANGYHWEYYNKEVA